jgi:predicted HAD superfamily hydrolase
MELIDSGHKVFLISDMYLSQVENENETDLSTIPLYLSSDLKMRKSDSILSCL